MKRIYALAIIVVLSSAGCSTTEPVASAGSTSASPPPLMAYCLYGNEPGCGGTYNP